MKKSKYLLPIIMSFSMMLTSCSGSDIYDFFTSLTGCSTGSVDKVGDTSTDADVTLKKYWENARYEVLDSTGDQKILVIPVTFKDSNITYSNGFNNVTVETVSETKERIYNTFFGSTDDTGWESVASYYEKSSYGKFHLTGQVSDEYVCDVNIKDLTTSEGKVEDYSEPTWYILRNAVEWVRNNCNDININDYDTNSDGYIDSVFLVYNVVANAMPSIYDRNGVLWAYTYWDYETEESIANPVGSVYGWASQSFMSQGGYEKPDAHVYIHETGHILGLDDYYTYDSASGDYNSMGGLDMMDYNIGDHDAFSKSLLGWTTPTHITEEGTYTLRPFESSGDCLVIRPNWNGSLYDEYLIIEYYTPTGLNELDSHTTYTGKSILFENAGIKVIHVDSRLVKIKQTDSDKYFNGYTTSLVNSYNNLSKVFVYSDVGSSNTISSSYTGYRLCEIIDGGVKNSDYNRLKLKTNASANDSFLFHASSNNKFGISDGIYENYTFNCGLTIDYGFTITGLNSSEATLEFTKL